MNNNIKTFLLLAGLSLLLIFVGGIIGGRSGVIMAFVFSLAMNGAAYFFSDKMALAANGAKPVSREEAPELYAMVEDLTRRSNMPMPRLYMTPEMQANAFATGRDPQHAAVAVTQGIMKTLSSDELKAVIAHELGHIQNRDILISSIAAVIASSVGFLANMAMFAPGRSDEENSGGGLGIVGAIAVSLLAPLVGSVIQMAISRSREFEADAWAKRAIGSGMPLANALKRIQLSVTDDPATQLNPAYSSMYIANPFGNVGGNMVRLFSTHPPVEDRIKRLLQG